MDAIDIEIADPPPAAAAPAKAPRPNPWQAWAEIVLCSGYPTQLLLGLLLQAAPAVVLSFSGLSAEAVGQCPAGATTLHLALQVNRLFLHQGG